MGRERRNLPYPPPLSPQGAARLRSQRPISFVSVPSALAPRLFHLEQNVPSSQSPSLGFGVSIRKEEQNRARGHRNAGSALCGWENSPECPNLEQRRIPGSEPPPPPAPIATFCTIPTFPKAKSRASSSGRPAAPTAVWGENTAFWPFCDRGCQRGGGGGLSPGHTKPPAPARPRGWRRGGAGGRARPHIAPRPSRPRPAAH